MATRIHPTAIIDVAAELGPDVVIDPFAIVGPGVTIGDGTNIGPRVIVERDTEIASGCSIGAGSVIGTAPQDRKYAGQRTIVQVGEATTIREYVTINRGVTGPTVLGPDCYIMSYAHVAHDCRLARGVILGNSVQMAGHVTIDEFANVGGLTPIHQFVRIGARSFVGGGSRVPQDVPPFALAAGNPLRLYGINVEGLRRAGFDSDRRSSLKRAYRLLFNSNINRDEALAAVRAEFSDNMDVTYLADFVAGSERGVLV